MELIALEGDGELLDEEVIAGHVGVPGVPFARDLLHHEDGVAEAYDSLDADVFGEPEAVDEGLVLGHVVGGGKEDLECVLEPVPLRG